MGALIGGLYSIGYDAETLDSLVSVQDWNVLLSDKEDMRSQSLAERDRQNTYILSRPLSIAKKGRNVSGGLISGSNLSRLFTRLTVGWHDSIDFAKLPIPFACVATNIVDNTEYDFHGGYLATAMRASMAIPGVFTPVRISSQIEDGKLRMENCDYLGDDGGNAETDSGNHNFQSSTVKSQLQKKELVLVDGGLRNNYPADLAKRMGADVIIGVSVQSDPRTADKLKSGSDILLQIVDLNCKNKFDENWAMTDIPIKVDVKGYSSASFNRVAIDTLIARGEQAAMKQWDKLVALKRCLGLADGYMPQRRHRTVPSSDALLFKIDSVSFDRIADADRDYIVSKYGLTRGDTVSAKRVEEALTALSTVFLYTNVSYNVNKHGDGYVLRIAADSRKATRINLGVRFDTEEMVALQANMSHRLNTKTPVVLEFTGRLGMRMMARLDASIVPLHYGKIGLSYVFRHDDINIYEDGKRGYNFTYNQHSVNLQALSFDIRNFSADPPELRVQGDISGDLSNALRYLRRTPMLRSIWNDAFDASEGRGPVETALSLVVPLEDAPHVRYSVRSHISRGAFRYADRLPWIQELSGELLVTERGVSTPNAFEGKTSGGPVKVSARTANGIVELHASGILVSADLPVLCLGPNVRMPIFDELSGTSPFEATIRIPLSDGGPIRVSARSDLKGLSSHLPAPLAKNAGDALPSSLELAFTHSGLQQIFFDMTRTGVVDLDLSKPIPKGFLAVGTARRANSEGVEADIELPRFDPNYWKHLLTAERVNPNLQTSASASSKPESNFFDALMTAFRKGRIKTEVLTAYGKEFKHVEANVYSQGPHWLASIQSEDISGTVEFEEAQDEAPLSLTMKLQRLHIPDTAAEDLDGLIRPHHVDRRRKLPNLSLRIDDLKIGTRRIGKVDLMAGYKFPKTSIGPWEIQRLSIFNVGGSLHGTGRWLPDDLGGKTTIHLRGEVEDAGRTLHSLDIREVVRRAPGSFSAELSWKGPITEFNTETLCGNIRLDAQRGSLLQVEPGAGRILSLLSMQHLLRRLQLDFRDVVSRGFDFDAIHSSGTLTDGIFHTEKTTIVGSSAAIVIGGNIDFVRDTLDLKALVLPSINAEGASLALAVANPAIGISTLIAQWMLKDQISELFSTEYVVSGTFAEPTLEKVDIHHDAKTAPKN